MQLAWTFPVRRVMRRLLRQYFPKKILLAHFSQDDLDIVALELNERPRKTLKNRTPTKVMSEGAAVMG